MAEAVFQAVTGRGHLCVEAGTGTGKTLAYLVPSLCSKGRVLVSTATRNLQDQIFFKDIPFIQEHLVPDLSATFMKGRQNYLCLRKLYEPDRITSFLEESGQMRQALKKWADESDTGDRSELAWLPERGAEWRQYDATSDHCTGQKCSYYDRCYITRMRQKALDSDLVVVNHALLFANLALETDEIGRILPEFSVLILDEAHEIEDIAAHHFGSQISSYQIDDICRDLSQVFSGSLELVKSLQQTQTHSAIFFEALPPEPGRYSLNLHPDRQGGTVDLRRQISAQFQGLQGALLSLYHHLQAEVSRPTESEPLIRRLELLTSTLDEIFNLEESESVYWYERRDRGVFLHVNPINVAPILEERLFSRSDSTVLTSATLTTNRSFDYLRKRLGISEPQEVITRSEFDYSRQTILYLPKALPEPRSQDYLPQALEEIKGILSITEGHAFLLFTSFRQLNRVHLAMQDEGTFPLLRQGDQPKNQLLERFRTTPNAVLLATSSFWQGVDVQGDALRAVVIDKLPFLVPTEPVIAARLNWLERQGENPFLRYTVPEAIITLKQGLGRLIRSRQDRGIWAILDSRLRSKSYGRVFLESLPNCPVTDNIELIRDFYHRGASIDIDGD